MGAVRSGAQYGIQHLNPGHDYIIKERLRKGRWKEAYRAVYRNPKMGCHGGGMKPRPAPCIPGNTDAERMDNAVRKFLTVSKADFLKAEAGLKRQRERKRLAKKTA